MDDSSLFMEWAMDTLQHLHSSPPGYAGGGADHTFPSLQALHDSASQNGVATPEPAAHEGHRATTSWSSGDTDSGAGGGGGGYTSAAIVEHDGWSPSPNSVAPAAAPAGGSSFLPVSWNFKSALTQPCNEATQSPSSVPVVSSARTGRGGGAHELTPAGSPPTRRASAKGGAAPYAQEHIMAERKRREKINQRFIELSTVIPGLKKMDKATILSDAVRYVRQLQEKLSGLEEQQNGRRSAVESAVLVKKTCIAVAAQDGPYGNNCPSSPAPAVTAGGGAASWSSLPEIEARISHGNVMVRIHCENGKGLLVSLLAEVEGLHLAVTHTNVMPFPARAAVVTIMAKVEEGFSITAEDIVGKLNSVLQQHSRKNEEETTNCGQGQGGPRSCS